MSIDINEKVDNVQWTIILSKEIQINLPPKWNKAKSHIIYKRLLYKIQSHSFLTIATKLGKQNDHLLIKKQIIFITIDYRPQTKFLNYFVKWDIQQNVR